MENLKDGSAYVKKNSFQNLFNPKLPFSVQVVKIKSY